MNRTPIAAAAIAALALAGCASTSSSTTSAAATHSSTAAASATAPPPLTCPTLTSDNNMTVTQVITAVVSDQKSQDASMGQGWVNLTDGSQTSQGNDLAAAASVLGSYAGTQLAADGSEFATDAQAFLSDESGGLMPGWTAPYRLIQHDIAKLGADCGVSYTVPAGE
jgi:type IV pilus biogenesis protein CpaD/CtpE